MIDDVVYIIANGKEMEDLEQQSVIQEYDKHLKDKFTSSLKKLKELLLQFNPFLILQGLLYEKYIKCCKRATDYIASENPTEAPLELIVSLMLRKRYDAFALAQPTPQEIQEIYDLAFNCCANFGWFNLSEDKEDSLFIKSIRNHTALVRGEGYPFQRRQYIEDLLRKIDTKPYFDMELNIVFDVLYKKLPAYLWHKEEEILKQISAGDEISLADYIDYILVSAEELVGLFPAGTEEERIISVLDALSLEFGELSEVDEMYLFLGKYVQKKPIIRINGKYFMFHIFRMLTNHKAILETLLLSNEKLNKAYKNRVRPEYLEERLSAILTKAFPNAIHLKNAKYQYEGQNFENDHTVILGDKAIIFEAKAARPKDSIYRGADKAFKENYENNIIYASKQADRFENFLKSQTGNLPLETQDGHIEVKPDEIKEFIKYNVVLDALPRNSIMDRNNMEEYAIAHEVETIVNPTFVLSDLEIVADLLDSEILLLDFLIKKYKLSFTNGFPTLSGDDIDLLGLYLDTGLNIVFDERYDSLYFSGYSSDMKIDEYYDLFDMNSKLVKPAIRADHKLMCIVNKIYQPKKQNINLCLDLLKMPFPNKNFSTKMINQVQFIKQVELGIQKAKKTKRIWSLPIYDIGILLVFYNGENEQMIRQIIYERNVINNCRYALLFNVKGMHRPFSNVMFLKS